ncbi:MAG: glutamate dehydrogenase, partial [Bacilli bacterium]|nr:glutamate dehydrogenase [Bacilli bacterium]
MIDLEKYSSEPEFKTAVTEMLASLDKSVLENPKYVKVLDQIVEPDRVITFDVEWVDDQGNKRVNKGYRVQFNNVNGVYKGGLRFHPSVNLSIL